MRKETITLIDCKKDFLKAFLYWRDIWKVDNLNDKVYNQMAKYGCLIDLMTRLENFKPKPPIKPGEDHYLES